MNLYYIIISLLVAAAVGFAVRPMRKPKKSGCCGSCSTCACGCTQRENKA